MTAPLNLNKQLTAIILIHSYMLFSDIGCPGGGGMVLAGRVAVYDIVIYKNGRCFFCAPTEGFVSARSFE